MGARQPELARSGYVPDQPGHEHGAHAADHPHLHPHADAGEFGPVPEENRPGHHPPVEQDKPTVVTGEPEAPPPAGEAAPSGDLARLALDVVGAGLELVGTGLSAAGDVLAALGRSLRGDGSS